MLAAWQKSLGCYVCSVTRIQHRNLLAHLFAFQIGFSILVVPIGMALSEPVTNWDILLFIACGILGPICYFKFLPYSRWLSGKMLEVLESFGG
jgi:hypothetical protein